jgi:hypothetical protein
MKSILLVAFVATACLEPMPEYIAAPDPEPEFCADDYPFDTPPDACESNSYGTCCTWPPVETDGGVSCIYDYCSYHDDGCEWHLSHVDCET